jgi:hypothetical protein
MADPLKIIRRLDAVTTDYAVFERDQVLTEKQLNSVVEYLDDQNRLTRTQLLGIGIVGGLWPTPGKGQISVGKGVGLTSDGDLLGLPADTVFDRWLAYDESAPAYEPFYVDGQMLPLIELLAADDKREGKLLAEMPDSLEKMVVVAFMESYENDPDLCTGGDCDNRGRTARNTQRLLLLNREIAEKIRLTAALPTGADIARLLPRVAASRADLGTGAGDKVTIASAEAFAAVYRNAGNETLGALIDAISTLTRGLGEVWPDDLPSPAGWAAQLRDIAGSMAGTRLGIQYYHAFAKDLVATWGDLRAALFADDSVLCPAAAAFPKHLLLGALADTSQLRTGRYPAPWLVAGAERERVRYLMRKFGVLVANFELPTGASQGQKIIPSRRETVALEQRAVPIYYRKNGEVRALWNEERRQRGESDDNLGYFWMPLAERNAADDPFKRDLGACDFFRIEGHLGLKADLAEPAIEKLVRQRNLPIAVISVLLHNRRDLVIRGPKFKKNSLHSLHYLLRQDLASHLKDNIAYSGRLIGDIKAAGASVQKLSANVLNADVVKPLEAAKIKLESADTDLVGNSTKPGPLSARSYKSFSLHSGTWTARFDEAVLTTSKAKVGLGDIMRNDMISPVDTVSGSKTHLWVNWLGDILKKREDDQKDRLLLTNMIGEHPGLEHFGGAVPGGTFVLAYDDSGIVIGDLMLPYWLDDNDESDQEEPELIMPDIRARLPDDLLPIKVIKPIELVLDDFRVTKILPEVKLQENYSNFFRESLGSLGDVLKNTKATAAVTEGVKSATTDRYLEQMLAIVKGQQEQIKGLREVAGDDRMTQATRDKAREQAKEMESQLAVSVGATVEYFAVAAPETVRFEADKAVVYETVGSAINMVTDKDANAKLQTNLKETAVTANQQTTGSSALVANQMMNNAGFRLG